MLSCAAIASRSWSRLSRRGADLDILEGNSQSNRLLLNDGSGGFTEDTDSTLAVGAYRALSIFAADVDGDGGACDGAGLGVCVRVAWR